MSAEGYLSIALVLMILLDASGDAFRTKDWQFIHHLMEAIHLGLWIAIWALFAFRWEWILVYVMARIWIFDLTYNIWVGNKLMYVGKNDLWGGFIRWWANLVKQPYENFSFIFKVMAFAVWIGMTIKILRY